MKRKFNTQTLKKFAIAFLVVGIVYILFNLYTFMSSVTSYTSQGYALGDVLKYLGPTQLVPYILDPLGLFGGFAVVCAGLSSLLAYANPEEAAAIEAAKAAKKAVKEAVKENVTEESAAEAEAEESEDKESKDEE